MTKVVTKRFSVMSIDKIDGWLNQMCQEGWGLVMVGGSRYIFEPCQPGAYQYQVDYISPDMTFQAKQDYIHFLRDSGVDYLTTELNLAYFRRPAQEGDFILHSDRSGLLAYLRLARKNARLSLIIGLPVLLALLYLSSYGFFLLLLGAFGLALYDYLALSKKIAYYQKQVVQIL